MGGVCCQHQPVLFERRRGRPRLPPFGAHSASTSVFSELNTLNQRASLSSANLAITATSSRTPPEGTTPAAMATSTEVLDRSVTPPHDEQHQSQQHQQESPPSLMAYLAFPFHHYSKLKQEQRQKRTSHDQETSHRAVFPLPMTPPSHFFITDTGAFTPLSLTDSCLRTICLAYQDGYPLLLDQDPLPCEVAARLLYWMKANHWLSKQSFQQLVPFLVKWDLAKCFDVEDSWFEDLSPKCFQQLQYLNVTNCRQLTWLGNSLQKIEQRRGYHYIQQQVQQRQDQGFEKLLAASFENCSKLDMACLTLLRPSSNLVMLNLSGCSRLEDHHLLALSRLYQLQKLNLSGCCLITDDGLRALCLISQLRSLNLSRCFELTDATLEWFPAAFANLEELEIAYCRFGDESTKSLGQLHQLQRLVIRGWNNITDHGLEALASLTKLKHFNARFCHNLSGPREEWVHLETLIMAHTQFEEPSAKKLHLFPNLTHLNLECCHLERSSFEYIAKCSQLEELILEDTCLDDQGLLMISQRLHQLTSLNVSSTTISNAGFDAIHKLQSLRNLYSDVSVLTNPVLAPLSKLSQLERLDLFGAAICDYGLRHLVVLKRLKELVLCRNMITDDGVKWIAKLTSLTALNLSQNKGIHSRSLRRLSSLLRLRHLNLSNTSVESTFLCYLYPLSNLRSLSLYGCVLQRHHIEELSEHLPQLRCVRCA